MGRDRHDAYFTNPHSQSPHGYDRHRSEHWRLHDVYCRCSRSVHSRCRLLFAQHRTHCTCSTNPTSSKPRRSRAKCHLLHYRQILDDHHRWPEWHTSDQWDVQTEHDQSVCCPNDSIRWFTSDTDPTGRSNSTDQDRYRNLGELHVFNRRESLSTDRYSLCDDGMA